MLYNIELLFNIPTAYSILRVPYYSI